MSDALGATAFVAVYKSAIGQERIGSAHVNAGFGRELRYVLGDAVEMVGADPALFEHVAVQLNGRPVDVIDGTLVRAGDEVVMAPRPRDLTTGIMLAIAVAGSIASAALAPKVRAPKISAASAEKRYTFGRFSQPTFYGDTIPVVFGYHPRWGGKVIKQVRGDGVDGDARLRLLILLSRGELEQIAGRTSAFDGVASESITGLWLNDQPISNFPRCKVSARFGAPSQSIIPGFSDSELEREVGVGGVAIPNTSGSERTGGSASGEAYTFTTLAPVQGVVVRIRFASGLYALSESGQVDPRRVQYRVRTRVTAGPGAWSAWQVVTIDRADQSEFYSSFRVDHLNGDVAAVHDVQVERVTVETGTAAVVDAMIFDSLVEVNYTATAYNGLAVLALELVAGESLTSVPRVSVEVKGVKVPVWDGVSPASAPVFSTQYTDNPLALALAIIENSAWGMSPPYARANVDMDSLLSAWAVADEWVPLATTFGSRRRYRCNLVLDEAKDGWEVLRAVCDTARVRPIPVGSSIRFIQEKVQATPAEVWTDASIAVSDDGEALFTYTRKSTTGGLVEPNQWTAQFANEQRAGEADALTWPQAGTEWLATEPVRNQSLRMDGVTHPEQIIAQLKFNAKKTRYQRIRIEATLSRPLVAALAGERVDLAFSLPGWGLASGRLAAGSTTSTVTLDRSVTLAPATAYSITVLYPDGTWQTKSVTSPAGSYAAGAAISVSGTFTTSPPEFAEYVLGPTVTQVKPFILERVSLEDAARQRWRIAAVEYDTAVFDDAATSVDLPDYSTLVSPDTPPGPVSDLHAFERTIGGVTSIELAWSQLPADAQITESFRIFRRFAGTSSWVPVANPSVTRRGAVFDVGDADRGYEFEVVAVSSAGAALSPYDPRHPIVSLVFGLSQLPPLAPATAWITQDAGNRYTLRWNTVADAAGYMVMSGGDWSSSLPNDGAEGCFILARADGQATASLPGLVLPPAQACEFWVRSVGLNDRPSWDAARVQISSPANPSGQTIKQTKSFTLSSEGTLTNLTWNGTTSRLEITTAGSDGRWESPQQDTGSLSLTELAFRMRTGNDADDPTLGSDPFRVPSAEADQWGVVSTGPTTVGMLMPPYPDELQSWTVEVRTWDTVAWSDWSTLAPFTSIRRNLRKYQFRVTLHRERAPYKPALAGFVVVATH